MGGELVQRDFDARPLQPTTATLSKWPQARAAAIDTRVSEGFRAIAAQNLGHI